MTFRPATLARPTSVDEVRRLVRSATSVRALGTGHSFSAIADTPGTLLSCADLPATIEWADPVAGTDDATVWVSASVRYAQLVTTLESRGRALPNLGSLPHIGVVGAVATGTHGSGNGNQVLSAAIVEIELVTADGDLVRIDQTDPAFPGAVVHLGALGVVTRVRLTTVPTFRVRQDVALDVPWATILEHPEVVTGAGYSVSIITDWAGDTVREVLVKRRVAAADPGADPVLSPLPAILAPYSADAARSTVAITPVGVADAWCAVLPHFRPDLPPSAAGDEIQTEYFVDRADASAALAAVRTLRDDLAPHLHLTELRTTAPDGLWLSGSYGRPTLAIHFTWRKHPEVVAAILPRIEAALAPCAPRPHWGKVASDAAWAGSAEVRPQLDAFRTLADRMDPRGRFRNPFVARILG